jgi:hypothetical protein
MYVPVYARPSPVYHSLLSLEPTSFMPPIAIVSRGDWFDTKFSSYRSPLKSYVVLSDNDYRAFCMICINAIQNFVTVVLLPNTQSSSR